MLFPGDLALDETRLRWQCRRGMLELDLLLNNFVDKKIDSLETLPAENKTNLIKIHKNIRKKFGNEFTNYQNSTPFFIPNHFF